MAKKPKLISNHNKGNWIKLVNKDTNTVWNKNKIPLYAILETDMQNIKTQMV